VFQVVRSLRALEEATTPLPDKIVDMRELTGTHIDFDGMREVARLHSEKKFEVLTRGAIVVGGPFQYGFARMWQSIAGRSNVEIEIFYGLEEALSWVRASKD
jgi:hypothetical protein